LNILKRAFNIGLCAAIQNLRINNKQIGGFNKVVILLKTQEWLGKYYIRATSNYGDHVFREEVLLWESSKFKTIEEAVGQLTKEVRIAQKKYPEIIFFKVTEIIDDKSSSYDEFIEDRWVKSKFEWDWDPILTMRDIIAK
jgi:hypothetical protein